MLLEPTAISIIGGFTFFVIGGFVGYRRGWIDAMNKYLGDENEPPRLNARIAELEHSLEKKNDEC